MLAGTPESVHAARAYTREFVGFHVPEAAREHLDDVLLVVSELVTNAVRYGTEPGDSLLLVLDAEPGRVRVEVHDTRRRPPRRRSASAERQRGHGLFIVDALAEWGVGERPMGKVVWAVVRW
ncbi:ATP-binding protein [Streptomyces sp. NPDC057654]|uniref:ATP-binding protein n=1 Tax=Streptomyces sp. NPDC057654 TaxID=3346196 RepID=UPI0036CFDA1E